MSSLSLLLVTLIIAHNAGFTCPYFLPYAPAPYVEFNMISYSMFEGDNLCMRCIMRSSNTPSMQFACYKGTHNAGPFTGYDVNTNHYVQLADSGYYSCEGLHPIIKVRYMVYIQVRELFSSMEMEVSPYPVVEGDVMTLTCDARLSQSRSDTELRFTLYRNGIQFHEPHSSKKYEVKSTDLRYSGNYKCEVSTRNGVKKSSPEKSIQVQELFSTPTIVTPYPVVEGDIMTLTCNIKLNPLRENTELQFTFYRDGRNIKVPSSFKWYMQTIHLGDSGNYKCEVSTRNSVKKSSQEHHIQVQELFSSPKLTMDPHPVVEGDPMTLTCDTNLNRYRKNTELKFAFHRDGMKVKGPGPSNEYKIQHVLMEHSGNYNCEISTRNGVKKLSRKQHITVQEIFSTPKIEVTPNPVVEGDLVTMTCDTSLSPLRDTTELDFVFYKNGTNIREPSPSKNYELPVAHLDDSGNYSCEVSTKNGVKKLSKEKEIQIEERFSTPVLVPSQNLVPEGGHMSLMCNTSLSPHRLGTHLQFAFYNKEMKVQEFDSSNIYEIQSAQSTNSGNYYCEVSATNDVKKKSLMKFIQIQGLQAKPSPRSKD